MKRCQVCQISEGDFLSLSHRVQEALENEGWLELADSIK
jgi:hypothetical protein